jgi:hypothetical protein
LNIMSETLEFPSIASEVVEQGAIATTSGKIDLASIDLTDVALSGFGDWKAQVDQAKKKLKGLVLDMPTQAKVDEFKSLRQSLINVPRAEARKTSKTIKSKIAKTSKAVGEAEEQIVTAWDEAETLITPAIDKRQAELDDERARKAAGQAFRVALHNALIARINGYVEAAQGLASDRISKGVEFVEGLTFGAECQELKPKYEEAQQNTLVTLRKMLADTQASEAAEAIRLENERVTAELAAQRKVLDDQAAALLRQRVAATHAIVFAFPEPKPAATIAAAPASTISPVAANNAARAEIAAAAAEPAKPNQKEPVSQEASEAMSFLSEVAGLRTPKPDSEPPVPTPPARRAASAHVAAPVARITLGQINERLAPISVTAAGLAELGFTHTTEKASKQYPESDFPLICDALIKRLEEAKAGKHLEAV